MNKSSFSKEAMVQRKVLIYLGFVVSIAMLFGACGGGGSTATDKPATPATAVPVATSAPAKSNDGQASGAETIKIELGENPYDFKPIDFKFELGKTYNLAFEAPGEFHTFTVADLGINVFINANEAVTQTVTFSKAGNFPLVCTPHETNGMVGTITVA